MSHATDWQLVTDVAAQCISLIFESQNFSCTAYQPASYNITEEKKPEAFFSLESQNLQVLKIVVSHI
jgi:hypothetical protein